MSEVAEPSYRKRVVYQAGLLGAFSMVAATLLVIGNLATRETIEQRRADDLLASLSEVIPAELHDNDLLSRPLIVSKSSRESVVVYRALQERTVSGVAFRITGQGYAGAIEMILGLNAQGEILGVRTLSHAETPGLGDSIEVQRDDWILGFKGLSLSNLPAEHWAVKKDGGDFDQFTGATITPRAVVAAIKEGLELFQANRQTFLARHPTPDGRVEEVPTGGKK